MEPTIEPGGDNKPSKHAPLPMDRANNAQFSPWIHQLKQRIFDVCEGNAWMSFMGVLTIWTLYQGDIRIAGTDKDADLGFEVIISICFFLFSLEILLQCFYKDGYLNLPSFVEVPGESWKEAWQRRLNLGSFYFWMDIVATFTLIFDMFWMLDSGTQAALNGGGAQSAQGGRAARVGARVGRIIRLVRMIRLVRIGKLYKYAIAVFTNAKVEEEKDDTEESKVGTAMGDLTNRRVIVLILLMLVIIPLLNVTDPDVSLSLAVQLVHSLAELNSTDPSTYETGLLLAINITKQQLPVIALTVNEKSLYYDHDLMASLRSEEKIEYYLDSNGTTTDIYYDQRTEAINSALYSIYTTTFVIVLLLGGIYAFSTDVQTLVIQPIEKLVALVKKIAENPLGVEYKMLGEEDGFQDGMETTVLLTTINKIGGLMKVGFGEAGAAIIARNLSDSTGGKGKLNLLGKGTMIYSIFGFCDVRQFTDTTECLQEEVMLFVNRIAHILHSIVVQCSGAANKNIGDAFLLTWKIDEKATKEQKALLADQALLTFCKALIELARHQEFICNFSVAATGRLFKRFPDYKVRIGSGLHVGWAIEGAIGSNRKIDASYISPHVSTTEFLESSTKEYGVSLLMSEPFYRLLSPAAARFVRQVDRIRRSEDEGPMGLYTYDCDLSIDWNDPYRHRKKSTASTTGPADARSRFQSVVRRTSKLMAHPGGIQAALGLTPIQEVKSVMSASTNSKGGDTQSQASRNNSNSFMPFHKGRAGSSVASEEQKRPMRARGSVYSGARRASIMIKPMVANQSYTALPLNEADEENPEAAEAEAAEKIRRAKMTPTIVVPSYSQQVWVEDQDLMDLRHVITDHLRSAWSEGMDAFIIGDWTRAKEKFSETLRLSGKRDGPSKHLLKYMEEYGNQSPDTWQGFRDLSDDKGH